MKTNISLIGLRGSGKSTIAKIISEKLNLKFVDLDIEIEKNLKLKIPEIIELHGWDFFRKTEAEVCSQFLAEKKQVIATGGGIILEPKNCKTLKENSYIIYLEITPEQSLERCKNQPRPKLEQDYQLRHKIYSETADLIIKNTDLQKTLQTILEHYEN